MRRDRWASNLHAQEIRALLVHFLGSRRWTVVLMAVGLLVFTGWFADSFYALLDSHLQRWWGTLMEPSPWVTLWLSLPFVALVTFLVLQAKRARSQLVFRVTAERNPPQCRGLILFLSPPRTPEERTANLAVTGALGEPATLAQIQGPWRMPLEALAYHRQQLREVVVVFSAGKNEAKNHFLELVRRLWPDGQARIRTHSEVLGDLQDGVDFFDLEAMVAVTEALFHQLQQERHLKASEILIDITGGPKVASAAGAVVALVEWRRFQYVQQTTDGDFMVTTFDPTYETAGAA